MTARALARRPGHWAIVALILPSFYVGQGTVTCPEAGWSSARPVVSDGVWLSAPSLAFRDDEVLVAGNLQRGPERWERNSLAIVRIGAEPLPVPDGDFFFIRPALVMDREGRAHLFWGEPFEGYTAGDSLPDIVRIYYSAEIGDTEAFTVHGRRVWWYVPQAVYSADDVRWSGVPQSGLVVGADEALHVALSIADPGQRLVHVRFELPRLLRLTEFLDTGLYPTLASGPDELLYLAYIAPVSGGPDVNSVFIRRSPDGGRTWEEPILVSRSGRLGAHGVQIAVDADGGIDLVWRKATAPGVVTRAVWHSRSTDGGATWTEPEPLPVPEGPANRGIPELQIAGGPSGRVYAVFTVRTGGGPRTFFSYRSRKSGWTAPCRLDPAPETFDPGLAVDDDGVVHVVWNRKIGDRATAMYRTFDPGDAP